MANSLYFPVYHGLGWNQATLVIPPEWRLTRVFTCQTLSASALNLRHVESISSFFSAFPQIKSQRFHSQPFPNCSRHNAFPLSDSDVKVYLKEAEWEKARGMERGIKEALITENCPGKIWEPKRCIQKKIILHVFISCIYLQNTHLWPHGINICLEWSNHK